MPKLIVWCPDCGNRDVEPVYYRETDTSDSKRSKWIRLKEVFYCTECVKLIVMPYVYERLGKKVNEEFGEPQTFP